MTETCEHCTHFHNYVQANPGNTKKDSRHRKYLMVWNNPPLDAYIRLAQYAQKKKAKYLLAKEDAHGGTPHIHFYIHTKSGVSWEFMTKQFHGAHLKIANGDDSANLLYGTKEGNYQTNIDFQIPEEFKTSNWEQMENEILENEYKNVEWKPWQQQCLDIMNTKPNRRDIHWFYEPIGNAGKSYLCMFMDLTFKCLSAEGKAADIYYQVKKWKDNDEIPECILIDIPREQQNKISYKAIESLKNGRLYSGKYEGSTKSIKLKPLHVFVFANNEPSPTGMSIDRYKVTEILEPIKEENENHGV